jgi:hypothetical protein
MREVCIRYFGLPCGRALQGPLPEIVPNYAPT